MKIILSVALLFCTVITEAQKLHMTLFGGISNYQGDLQSRRFTFQESNAAFGAGLLYEFTPKLYLRGNVTIGKVNASDRLTSNYPERNLSFSSPISDIHLGLEYDLLNSYERSLTPYVFGGISVFHFNPSTLDSNGTKVYLQPLGTEGQGFYQGRQKYNLSALALPFGAGVKLSLSQNIRVRLEMGLRKTFTDYLDDVSTTYADEGQLLVNSGQRAVDLAFRGDEDKGGLTYPDANTGRGNPRNKDWYYFAGLGISFRLSPMFNTSASGSRRNTGCPANVY
jgi:hypothetical protein